MTRTRSIVLFLAWISLANLAVSAAQQAGGEYQAKARFLANAPGFVEWPSSGTQSPGTTLLICVHGDFSFGTALAEQTRGTLVRGRHLAVKWARAEQDLQGCQVLFVSRSAAKRYQRVLQVVKDGGSLTIGEDPEFLKTGGMVSLESTDRGLTFDVNMDAVQEGRLKISSQLLSLARHVFRGSESARG